MPFLFPFNIPYILFSLVTRSCRKRRLRKKATERDKVNNTARFICKYRRIEAEENDSDMDDDTESDLGDTTSAGTQTSSSKRRKLVKVINQVKRKTNEGMDGGFGGG
jgi:hypothetical protein